MIPITPHNIRQAYGVCLEAAGLASALQNIETLLDLGYQEKFIEYFPSNKSFGKFKRSFAYTRTSYLEKLEWKYDQELLGQDPEHDQSIRDYFEQTFKPAILNAQGGGNP